MPLINPLVFVGRAKQFVNLTFSVLRFVQNPLRQLRSRAKPVFFCKFWSGKSRKEKIEQGIQKYPPIGKDTSFANMVKPIFASLNERVHGNTMVASYFSFDKHGEHADEYRGQVALGLLTLSVLFYLLIHAYCHFNGRGSEIKRFDFYYSYICNLLIKDSEETNSESI